MTGGTGPFVPPTGEQLDDEIGLTKAISSITPLWIMQHPAHALLVLSVILRLLDAMRTALYEQTRRTADPEHQRRIRAIQPDMPAWEPTASLAMLTGRAQAAQEVLMVLQAEIEKASRQTDEFQAAALNQMFEKQEHEPDA